MRGVNDFMEYVGSGLSAFAYVRGNGFKKWLVLLKSTRGEFYEAHPCSELLKTEGAGTLKCGMLSSGCYFFLSPAEFSVEHRGSCGFPFAAVINRAGRSGGDLSYVTHDL